MTNELKSRRDELKKYYNSLKAELKNCPEGSKEYDLLIKELSIIGLELEKIRKASRNNFLKIELLKDLAGYIILGEKIETVSESEPDKKKTR